MNTNMTITCEVCEKDTDCRIGYSNRTIQPLSFACPHCSALIKINLDISDAPASKFQFENCYPSKNRKPGPFDGSNPFVDLHLDFPVKFGKYIMGNTPFMMAMEELGRSCESDENLKFKKLEFHGIRLNQLNTLHDKSNEIKSIINLYHGSDKLLFKSRVGKFLNQDQGKSLEPEDINAALYRFISFTFTPFIDFHEVKAVVNGYTRLLENLPRDALDSFMEKIISSRFLSNLQKDCLKLYPEIYSTELAIRPALYLDLIPDHEKAKTAARISTQDFQTFKDLYKDMAEIFSRQLILIAGINNIIKRGDFNLFQTVSGGKLSSLDKFSDKTLTEKFKYLDDCWHAISAEVIDAEVRNSIAHHNIDYNEVTQKITYYPDGGKIEESAGHTIYFLDFMRMVLLLFRELHNIHHLIKCLFYYEILIRSRRKPKK